MNPHLNSAAHRIDDASYAARCREQLDVAGALVLKDFFTAEAVAEVIEQSEPLETSAFYAASTHNVYLTPPDSSLPESHPFNR